jgi:hypothetical protein
MIVTGAYGSVFCFSLPSISVADPYHFDVDPDPTCYFDADPDPASHFDADPDSDPTFHFVRRSGSGS